MTPELGLLAPALALSYLVGSIPTGYVLVKWVKRLDVRTLGSGNIGATNVTRVAGPGLGKLVFVLDLAKGWLAARLIAGWLVPEAALADRLACGVCAVLGHSFPVFLRFRGGKGVATTIGVLLGTMPLVALASLAVWIGAFLAWRYVSLASLAASLSVPVFQGLARQPCEALLLGACLSLLIVIRHAANIARLARGSELRFTKRAG